MGRGGIALPKIAFPNLSLKGRKENNKQINATQINAFAQGQMAKAMRVNHRVTNITVMSKVLRK